MLMDFHCLKCDPVLIEKLSHFILSCGYRLRVPNQFWQRSFGIHVMWRPFFFFSLELQWYQSHLKGKPTRQKSGTAHSTNRRPSVTRQLRWITAVTVIHSNHMQHIRSPVFFCFVMKCTVGSLYSCVSEMGQCRRERQVQITHEKWVHPNQLWNLPSWERLSISPHFNQGKCFCCAALSSKYCHSSFTNCTGQSRHAYCWKLLLCFHIIRYCDWNIKHLVLLLPLCYDQRHCAVNKSAHVLFSEGKTE